MAAHKEPTHRVISRNLDMLVAKAGIDLQQAAIRAGVGIRTVHNIRAGGNPTVETVDALGRVFGLTGWHLLNPNLAADLDNQEWLDRVREIFGTAPYHGLDLVKDAIKAAETTAAVYKVK